MRHTYTEIFFVYLTLQFNWVSYIVHDNPILEDEMKGFIWKLLSMAQ